MINNDVLRRLRYAFDYSDQQMMDIFAQAECQVTRDQVCNWLKAEEDPDFVFCDDTTLAIFLNGLINHLRGKKDGPQPEPEQQLSNNMIFMKLRIALNLKSDEVLVMLEDVGMSLSQHELTALFRKPGHKHYRECKDQILRNFLKAVQLKYRGQSTS
ncbi:DUF1456 family protein [Pseudohongiella sp.]|uniref:DUF1456 domain-containing protein n=1 Tax=marine sediment metagenome TaxID=412755 RepID=A0A0F9Y357_9ZZZZ|nr:DUF1456 family protein [Pseudohongiella sp.]HDZ08908.1 DUF1456 family protein [Pseudohongiella sp.]HEA64014.1 DUF1456 family protein [Pseudohongiella sp.]